MLGSLEQRLLKKVEYEEDLRHTDGQYYKIVEYKLQLSESTNRICQENTNKIKAHHGNTQNRIGT